LAGALPQTPLGELTALPRPLIAVFRGGATCKGRGEERRERERKGREGRGGSSFFAI